MLAKFVPPPGCCSNFEMRGHRHESFSFLSKMAEIFRGQNYDFVSAKLFMAMKSDVGLIKPDFWGAR